MPTTESSAPIRRSMTIDSIFSSLPQKAQRLAQELTRTGLHCVGCGAATHETLEQGCRIHGMSEEAIDALVERLNRIALEKSNPNTVSLTKKAAEKYREILKASGKEGWGLRFDQKKSGCKGHEYLLDFSEKADPQEDVVISSHGIEIHIRTEELPQLLGSEIDWADALMGGGFKVSNPNVKKSCGCGNSHSY